MISNLSAEFASPEHAADAVRKVRDSVRGVYSAAIRQTPVSGRAVLHRAITDSSFLSAVPVNDDLRTPSRKGATVFIVCETGCSEDICSIFSNMGGMKIQSSDNCSPG